jgi:hypothetical protein
MIPVGQPNFVQGFFANLFRLGPGYLMGRYKTFRHIPKGRLIVKKVMALKHKTDAPPDTVNLFFGDMGKVKGVVFKNKRTAVGPFQKINTPEQGGFSRSAWADNGYHIPLVNLKTQALQNNIPAKSFFDIPNFKHIGSPFFRAA